MDYFIDTYVVRRCTVQHERVLCAVCMSYNVYWNRVREHTKYAIRMATISIFNNNPAPLTSVLKYECDYTIHVNPLNVHKLFYWYARH